jgi:hypothetical protein
MEDPARFQQVSFDGKRYSSKEEATAALRAAMENAKRTGGAAAADAELLDKTRGRQNAVQAARDVAALPNAEGNAMTIDKIRQYNPNWSKANPGDPGNQFTITANSQNGAQVWTFVKNNQGTYNYSAAGERKPYNENPTQPVTPEQPATPEQPQPQQQPATPEQPQPQPQQQGRPPQASPSAIQDPDDLRHWLDIQGDAAIVWEQQRDGSWKARRAVTWKTWKKVAQATGTKLQIDKNARGHLVGGQQQAPQQTPQQPAAPKTAGGGGQQQQRATASGIIPPAQTAAPKTAEAITQEHLAEDKANNAAAQKQIQMAQQPAAPKTVASKGDPLTTGTPAARETAIRKQLANTKDPTLAITAGRMTEAAMQGKLDPVQTVQEAFNQPIQTAQLPVQPLTKPVGTTAEREAEAASESGPPPKTKHAYEDPRNPGYWIDYNKSKDRTYIWHKNKKGEWEHDSGYKGKKYWEDLAAYLGVELPSLEYDDARAHRGKNPLEKVMGGVGFSRGGYVTRPKKSVVAALKQWKFNT